MTTLAKIQHFLHQGGEVEIRGDVEGQLCGV
jgi:hypothetical protein